MRKMAIALIHFVALNLISGVFVAGIDAGKVNIFIIYISFYIFKNLFIMLNIFK